MLAIIIFRKVGDICYQQQLSFSEMLAMNVSYHTFQKCLREMLSIRKSRNAGDKRQQSYFSRNVEGRCQQLYFSEMLGQQLYFSEVLAINGSSYIFSEMLATKVIDYDILKCCRQMLATTIFRDDDDKCQLLYFSQMLARNVKTLENQHMNIYILYIYIYIHIYIYI